MKPTIQRCPENPIVTPGLYPWRKATVFNPAVIYDEGRFYMYERAAGGLRPFQCCIGMLESEDGIHFYHTVEEPVITPETLGSEYGSVQDPRIVKIDATFFMTVAFRPFAWHSIPTGVGVPDSHQGEFPGFDGDDSKNQTRSGILKSTDRVNWEFVAWVNELDIDDRNVILFPEKIDGRYAALRRPTLHVGTNTEHGTEHPHINISYSHDMVHWTEPESLLRPIFQWEDNRIGGSTPPIRTAAGWLVFYHGVENRDPKAREVVYRLGAALLDIDNPKKVLARSPECIMEPQEYYEHFGLYIPHVIFPTAAILREDTIYLYYGVCDTAIALATLSLGELLDYLDKNRC